MSKAEAPDLEAQRRELLRELEQHRQRIEAVLSPEQPAGARLARMGQGGFPRSHTMRLILSEPLLMAAVSGLAVKLVGQRAAAALPLAVSVAKAVHGILQSGQEGGGKVQDR